MLFYVYVFAIFILNSTFIGSVGSLVETGTAYWLDSVFIISLFFIRKFVSVLIFLYRNKFIPTWLNYYYAFFYLNM